MTRLQRALAELLAGLDPGQLPAPVDDRPGCVTWPGGTQALGPMLKIPGRTLWIPEHAPEAIQHTAGVLAALSRIHHDIT